MDLTVFRVLINARPSAGPHAHTVADHATLSVAVQARDPETAQHLALELLPSLGWVAHGPALRVSDLTSLLRSSQHEPADSAFGDYARQWLQIVHDEALAEGSSLHLLSVDYEYLDQPRRLAPRDPL